MVRKCCMQSKEKKGQGKNKANEKEEKRFEREKEGRKPEEEYGIIREGEMWCSLVCVWVDTQPTIHTVRTVTHFVLRICNQFS